MGVAHSPNKKDSLQTCSIGLELEYLKRAQYRFKGYSKTTEIYNHLSFEL